MGKWEDVERKVAVSITTPSVGGLAPTVSASYEKRQKSRFDDMLGETALAAGMSREQVLEGLAVAPDGPRIRLLEDLILASTRTSDRNKIRNLAHTAANVLDGDDAVIQRLSVMVPTIVDLESVHVALLATLRQRAESRIGGSPTALESVTKDELTLRALVAQLISKGLIEDLNAKSAFPLKDHNPLLTAFGEVILDYLLEINAEGSVVG